MTQDFGLGPALPTDDPVAVLRYILETYKPAGFALEFGVASGTSARVIAAHMPVVGFDWFRGLPEFWLPGCPAGHFACDPPTIFNCKLVVGLFADTLPVFDFAEVSPVELVHIDCDLYSSTVTVLHHVMPHLPPGCFVIFDEFHGIPGSENHEGRAFREYAAAHPGLSWVVVGHGGSQWVIQLT